MNDIERTPVEELREQLVSMNPEALYADGFEDALVGIGYRCGQLALAVYSVQKCVGILIERDGMDYEGAMEFLEFNSIGAWVGEHTPIWMYD
jgi:hypothetical protein